MTQLLIDRATLEQAVDAIESLTSLVRDEYTQAEEDTLSALRKSLAGAEPTGWQPIGTAPMDGTRVLIKGDGTTQVAGYGRVTGCDFDSWVIANDVHIPNPTHWMKKP